MSAPVLYVVAGPNGSGKSTFAREALQPITHLPFINADEIAAQRWPGAEERHAYDAAAAAAAAREEALRNGRSFITETVFSHPSKVELVRQALALGFLAEMHVMLVPEDLAVARVAYHVDGGGHTVPEDKVRERYRRLWEFVAQAARVAHRAHFYDNSRADAFAPVASLELGRPAGTPAWPSWSPAALISGL